MRDGQAVTQVVCEVQVVPGFACAVVVLIGVLEVQSGVGVASGASPIVGQLAVEGVAVVDDGWGGGEVRQTLAFLLLKGVHLVVVLEANLTTESTGYATTVGGATDRSDIGH